MKQVYFKGDSLKQIQSFPAEARRKAGFELGQVQQGKPPSDSKPLPVIAAGVEEIRIWLESGTFRVIYIARRPEAVYVLHAFQKKTQATSKKDLDLARKRFGQLGQKQM